jgi:hypothetical protein
MHSHFCRLAHFLQGLNDSQIMTAVSSALYPQPLFANLAQLSLPFAAGWRSSFLPGLPALKHVAPVTNNKHCHLIATL